MAKESTAGMQPRFAQPIVLAVSGGWSVAVGEVVTLQ